MTVRAKPSRMVAALIIGAELGVAVGLLFFGCTPFAPLLALFGVWPWPAGSCVVPHSAAARDSAGAASQLRAAR